jgi:hypothetical protein
MLMASPRIARPMFSTWVLAAFDTPALAAAWEMRAERSSAPERVCEGSTP